MKDNLVEFINRIGKDFELIKLFQKITMLYKGAQNYIELVKDILFSLMISVVISLFLNYCLLNIPYWNTIEKYDFMNLLAAGIGVAGVILGLYSSNIISIFSARYIKAPDDIFQLFITNFATSAGMKIPLFYIVYSFCLFLHLLFIDQNKISAIGVLFWGVTTLVSILTFSHISKNTLSLTDAFKLLGREFSYIDILVDRLSRKGLNVNDKSMADFSREVQRCFQKMSDIEDYAFASKDFSKESLANFLCVNIYLLQNYMKVKDSICYNSSWYPQRTINPFWYEINESLQNIYLKSGAIPELKWESDHFFFERCIMDINWKGLIHLIQQEDVYYLNYYLNHIIRQLQSGVSVQEQKFLSQQITQFLQRLLFEPKYESDFLALEKQKNEEFVSMVVDRICCIYIAFLLGLKRQIESYCPFNLENILIKSLNFHEIDFKSMPYLNNEKIKKLYAQLETENNIEEKLITPAWFIQQQAAEIINHQLNEAIRITIRLGTNDLLNLLQNMQKKKCYDTAGLILIQIQGYYIKWQKLYDIIQKQQEQLKQYYVDRKTYVWENNIDIKTINNKWLETRKKVNLSRVDILLHLTRNFKPENYGNKPDIIGRELASLEEWIVDCIAENDIGSFEKIYSEFRKIVLGYILILNKELESNGENLNPNWVFKQNITPVIDFIQISGYAYLWGEVTQNMQWINVLKNFSKNQKENIYLLQLYRSWNSTQLPITSERKFEWDKVISDKIEEGNYLKFQYHRDVCRWDIESKSTVVKNCVKCFYNNQLELQNIDEVYPSKILNYCVPIENQYKDFRHKWEENNANKE